ncbi:MAG: Fe-S cluster assembly protein HesB [Thermomicrobiales bacterium]|nr:Fe-S cluster assembly protein HesB [Thermomicrobiales bacterium]
MTRSELTTPLIGPSGEPVDFRRTINGHGVTSLPPMTVDASAGALRITLALPGVPPRDVSVRSDRQGEATIAVSGPPPRADEAEAIVTAVRHILRLDQDLSGFYEIAVNDPRLRWAARGAGRMTRCQTVYEDVVKTICTTNCTWSATVRMVNALVGALGEPALGAPENGWQGRAFPTPAAMAAADDAFYREIVRCGYRGAYLKKLARAVTEGEIDLEAYGNASVSSLPDDELAKQLLTLPGVGPYAAAHIMMMLGRYSRLILDSWTRPTYARLLQRDAIADAEIVERFSRYGAYAGLAFWLTITEEWVESEPKVEMP